MTQDGIVRHNARETLTFIGKEVVPQLIPLLKGRNDDVPWEAAKALSEVTDSRATSGLVVALEDRNFGLRWLAAEGLIAIRRSALIPLLGGIIQGLRQSCLQRVAMNIMDKLKKIRIGFDKQGLVSPPE